jgi:hypothetical protein
MPDPDARKGGPMHTLSPRSGRARRGTRAGAVIVGLVLAAISAGTVSAGVEAGGPWEDSFTDTACDAGYVIEGRAWGRDRILEPTPAQPEFFRFANQYNGATTVTNPETGAFFTEAWSGRFWEHSIERLSPDAFVYAYRSTDQGWYKVRDADGKLVYADQGRAVTAYVFDAVGDGSVGVPGGTYEGDPVELENTYDASFDFCALADELIG